jgi:protein TonB
MTAMKTLSRWIACSLGAHGLALIVLVLANANGITPREAIETVPFIHASLIYAMNGQTERKAPPTPRKKEAVAHPVRPVQEAAVQRPPIDRNKPAAETVSDAAPVSKAEPQRADDAGTVAAVSLHLPSVENSGAGQIASLGAASESRLRDGRTGESGRTDTGPMIPPRYRNASQPAYPVLARMRGYEGVVLLSVAVTEDGRAGEVRIKRSSGYALLDQSALGAVRRWRFEPARKMNAPIAMTVDIPVRFSLQVSD